MKLRGLLLIAGAFITLAAIPAMADLGYNPGSVTTIFDFICFTSKHCSAHVPINSAGTEIATSANPIRTDPTGTTIQPVSAVALGTTADVPCTVPTSATACTDIAVMKAIANVANSPTPACAAAPCGTTVGNVGVDVSSGKGTPASQPINVSTATTTQIVALSGSTKIYITSFDVIAGGTGNITFEYGTGASCGTGTTALTGAYPLTAQNGISKGSGVGAVLIVPAGNALCVLTSAAVQMSGSVSYQQF